LAIIEDAPPILKGEILLFFGIPEKTAGLIVIYDPPGAFPPIIAPPPHPISVSTPHHGALWLVLSAVCSSAADNSYRRQFMAKSQKRNSREPKKPKSAKAKPTATASPFTAPVPPPRKKPAA
jgi:hypothetical protein